MIFRVVIVLCYYFIISASLFADENTEFLPQGSYFEPITLDPATPQLGASMNAYFLNGAIQKKAYIPVLIGLNKILLRASKNNNEGWEFGFEYGVYSQFLFSPVREMVMGGLENADYRISGIAHLKKDDYIYRFKIFHQSSHLGDDHIIRNEITTPTSNIQNYEEFSVMYIKYLSKMRYYLSGGYNIGYYTIRGRVLFQGGIDFVKTINNSKWVNLTGGLDLKIYEQNNYTPNWRMGFGIEIGRGRSNALKILVEYYNGHLAYSTMEPEKVQLIGVGMYITPDWKIKD